MARLPRLLIDRLPHWVSLKAQHGQAMVQGDVDCQVMLGLLRDAAARHRVSVHACALQEQRLDLIATPQSGPDLSLMMQAVARGHALAYNRRYGRRGGLWEGRFRAAVIEPQTWLLRCMALLETQAGAAWVSRSEHRGGLVVRDPDVYWSLGNTPFEREARYARLKQEAAGSTDLQRVEAALRGGWVIGSGAFVEMLAQTSDRAVMPRRPGRPKKRLQ